MGFGAPEAGLGHVKAGNLKMLAVTGDQRIKSLPDVPTLNEQGVDMVMNGWQGLFAPARTPDAILDKIEKDTKQALTSAQWLDLLVRDGSETPPDRPAGQQRPGADRLRQGQSGQGDLCLAGQRLDLASPDTLRLAPCAMWRHGSAARPRTAKFCSVSASTWHSKEALRLNNLTRLP
jgi:hypothetical protein